MKLQHPPPPSAPLGNLLKDVLFKFPSPWARIVFKCLNPSASFNFIDGHSFCKGKSSDKGSLHIGQQLSGHFCFNSPPQPGKGSFFTPLTTDNNQMPLGYWRGEFVASNWSGLIVFLLWRSKLCSQKNLLVSEHSCLGYSQNYTSNR